MNIVRNEKLIRRNARIGQITSLASLAVLGAGMYITFTQPEQFNLALLALLVGFILSQVGIYYGNRWGRSPRPDELLDQALKGLSKEYTLYHYATPTSHLLVGPAGIWTLLPYPQRGTITYEKKRWRLRGGGFLQTYMRIFGQEGLGRPDLEAGAEIERLRRYLARFFSEEELPEIQAALVFTDPRATIQADEAPLPTLPLKRLKEFIRRQAKERPLRKSTLDALRAALPD